MREINNGWHRTKVLNWFKIKKKKKAKLKLSKPQKNTKNSVIEKSIPRLSYSFVASMTENMPTFTIPLIYFSIVYRIVFREYVVL